MVVTGGNTRILTVAETLGILFGHRRPNILTVVGGPRPRGLTHFSLTGLMAIRNYNCGF